jgi:hypothetical protein
MRVSLGAERIVLLIDRICHPPGGRRASVIGAFGSRRRQTPSSSGARTSLPAIWDRRSRAASRRRRRRAEWSWPRHAVDRGEGSSGYRRYVEPCPPLLVNVLPAIAAILAVARTEPVRVASSVPRDPGLPIDRLRPNLALASEWAGAAGTLGGARLPARLVCL